MKLSKKELASVLMEAAHHTFEISGGRCVEIHDALIDGTLDIEGYERAEWTTFDPDDPKTFPKLYPVLIRLNYGGIDICSFYDGKFQTGVVDSYDPEKITHWRPLPKPPVESEEQQ